MSTIRVTRGTGYRDAARAYKVLIDGAEAGTIRKNEEQRFEVPAGEHTLQMKVDWCKSPQLNVTIPEGGEASYVCTPGGNSLMALPHALFTPGNYIKLEAAQA